MANIPFIYFPPSNTGLPGGIPTANTVEYMEKGIDEEGPYYNVQYYINNWSDSDTFVNALLGYSTTSGQTTGGVTKRSPHQYPLSPNLYCKRARCMPVGSPVLGTSGLPDYNGGAVIQAEYRPARWQFSGQNIQEQIDPSTPAVFCTQRLKHTVEYINIDKVKLYYATGGSTGQDFRLRVPITELSLTFHLSPNLFIVTNAIRQMRGCVNSTTFLGAAAGCVLFHDGGTVRTYDALGNVVQEIEMVFLERGPTQKWNQQPGDDPFGQWIEVRGGGTSGNPPYPSLDFTSLIFGI